MRPVKAKADLTTSNISFGESAITYQTKAMADFKAIGEREKKISPVYKNYN